MARKKDEGGAGAGTRLTPVDVQQIQFRRALRGYDEQEVDDFLDRVTEELTHLIDERRSATERAGSLPTVRVASAGAAAATSAEAEQLVRQARERADQIIREANQRAAAIVREAEARAAAGGLVAAGAGGSAAIAGFVTKEREFLQQLASLVQGHAEGVKSMVASARDTSASTGQGPAPGPAAAAAGGAAVAAASQGDRGATGPTGGDAPGGSGSGPAQSSAGAGSSADSSPGGRFDTGAGPAASASSPVVVAGAAVATEVRPRERTVDVSDRQTEGKGTPAGAEAPSAPDARPGSQRPIAPGNAGPAADQADSSLRELFWGED
jgi:cell division initiation protein